MVKHLAGKHEQKRHAGKSGPRTINTTASDAAKLEKLFNVVEQDGVKEGAHQLVNNYGLKTARKILDFYQGREIAPGVCGQIVLLRPEYDKKKLPTGRIYIATSFIDGRGREVGDCSRKFGGNEIEHVGMFLKPSYQNKGIATRFVRDSEDLYRAIGAKRVTLQAEQTIGGYAWATMGYDFANKRSQDRITRDAKELSKSLGLKLAIPKHAYEIAAMTIPYSSGMKKELNRRAKEYEDEWDESADKLLDSCISKGQFKFGKFLLLGSKWSAKKDLYNSTQVRIGNDLYNRLNH